MADNLELNAGSGGATARTDEISAGLHVAAVKLYTGADGVDGGFASDTNRAHVGASIESSSMTVAGVNVTPKYAVIDAATSGDNTLVAAVTAKKVRVLALYLVAAGTVNVRFESGAGGTALSGQMNLVANTGFVLPFNPAGWFETASNTLLNLELSAAISVDGTLTYIEV